MTIDIWDPPDTTCKQCGYDGGHKHAKAIHALEIEKVKLEAKLKSHEGMSSDDRSFTIVIPVIVRSIAAFLISIVIGISTWAILNPSPPMNTYDSKTLNMMESIYEQCIQDPVAMPADCIHAMQVVTGNSPSESSQ